MALLKSELRKVLYARANWGLLIAASFLSIIGVVTTPFVLGSAPGGMQIGLDTSVGVDAVYANAISGYIMAIIIGVMLMAGEYRHGTAVATFLTRPKREIVLFAKLGISALVGSILMLVSTWLSILSGVAILTTFEEAVSPSSDIFINLTLAAIVSGAVLGIIGVSIGALLKSQIMGIVFSLIYVFIIDPLLLVLFVEAGKFLPSGLITAMLSIDIEAPELGLNTSSYFDPIPSALLLLSYGAVFATIAMFTSMRRDVD